MKRSEVAILLIGMSLLTISLVITGSYICLYLAPLKPTYYPDIEHHLIIPSIVISCGVLVWGIVLCVLDKKKN